MQCQSRLAEVLTELEQFEEAKRLHGDSVTRLNALFDDIDPRVLSATFGLEKLLVEDEENPRCYESSRMIDISAC